MTKTLLLTICLLLSGCFGGDVLIASTVIPQVQQLCENNGGQKYVKLWQVTNDLISFSAVCGDGTYISKQVANK